MIKAISDKIALALKLKPRLRAGGCGARFHQGTLYYTQSLGIEQGHKVGPASVWRWISKQSVVQA
jgi:hypothetical protein